MKAKAKKANKPVEIQEDVILQRDDLEILVEWDRITVPQGEGKPDIRQLEIEMGCNVNDKDKFLEWCKILLNNNYIQSGILANDNPDEINSLLKKIGCNRLLFDVIIIAFQIAYVDVDGREGGMEVMHHINLTVAGKRYMEKLQ